MLARRRFTFLFRAVVQRHIAVLRLFMHVVLYSTEDELSVLQVLLTIQSTLFLQCLHVCGGFVRLRRLRLWNTYNAAFHIAMGVIRYKARRGTHGIV